MNKEPPAGQRRPSFVQDINDISVMAAEKGDCTTPSITPPEVDPPNVPDDEWKPGLRFHAAFGSLCVMVLATAMDATMLAPALPVSGILQAGDFVRAT